MTARGVIPRRSRHDLRGCIRRRRSSELTIASARAAVGAQRNGHRPVASSTVRGAADRGGSTEESSVASRDAPARRQHGLRVLWRHDRPGQWQERRLLRLPRRHMSNFVDFIGEGRGSQALAKALVDTERRVESLTAEVDGLRRSREKVFRTPPIEWISDRMGKLQDVLEQRTVRFGSSAAGGPRPDPHGARNSGHWTALLPGDHEHRRSRLNRTAPRRCGGRFEFFAKVETAGIEPASAVAQKVASTSVAGALFSPSDSPRRRGCREPAP